MDSEPNESRRLPPVPPGRAAGRHLTHLTPMVVGILALAVSATLGLFLFEAHRLNLGLVHNRLDGLARQAEEDYGRSLGVESRSLEAMLETLRLDDRLTALLAARDRAGLLARAGPLFQSLQRDHGLTHFYFIGPDRVALLRVHAPDRYGDRIDRLTALEAERTGATARGLELGPLGTLTLRVVSPWRDGRTGALVGYVELGIEIDRVVGRLGGALGHAAVVLLDKRFLDRGQWEEGMRLLRRPADWDRFSLVVVSSESPGEVPLPLVKPLELGMKGRPHVALHLDDGTLGEPRFHRMSVPIRDAMGRSVAEIAWPVDTGSETGFVFRAARMTAVGAAVIGVLLIGLFAWQARLLSRRIAEDQQALRRFAEDQRELQRLATRDSLTGLWNRRRFEELLQEEVARASRFGHPLGLLMVDIDAFKAINDRYGHVAGDRVLQGVCERLLAQVRRVDRVCRYGGEEIAVILPESDGAAAQAVAERICSAVRATAFVLGEGLTLHVSVSVGIAVYPDQADSKTFLILAADHALYAAKEGGRNRACLYRGQRGRDLAPPSESGAIGPGIDDGPRPPTRESGG